MLFDISSHILWIYPFDLLHSNVWLVQTLFPAFLHGILQVQNISTIIFLSLHVSNFIPCLVNFEDGLIKSAAKQ